MVLFLCEAVLFAELDYAQGDMCVKRTYSKTREQLVAISWNTKLLPSIFSVVF